ncbi:MAG: relaxase domain-containing protein [Acidimicrobiales bacterium]
MLRVTTIHASSAHHSARYYTRYLADDGPEEHGVWLGRQAKGLGLAGRVSTEDLEALLSGRDPVGTGTRLGAGLVDRVDAKGRLIRAVAGFDATFSAPKSLIDQARRQAEEHGTIPDSTPEPTYVDPDADGERDVSGPVGPWGAPPWAVL